jgi:hypothetical protein
MPRSADYRLHLPAMGRAPELEVDEPALVVIYQEANADRGGRRVCVAVGETVNLYTDVDITGWTMALVDPPPPGCPVLTPRVLPSGAAPGEPSFVEGNRVWGQGTDRIALAAGEAPLGSPAEWLADPAVPRTVVRGLEAAIVAIGDGGVGEMAILWRQEGCTYTLWLAPGTTVEQAMAYGRAL